MISIASLIAGGICTLVILVDLFNGHKQKMTIMNWVWPITGIWSGPIGLWAYFHFGRMKDSPDTVRGHGAKQASDHSEQAGEKSQEELEKRLSGWPGILAAIRKGVKEAM